MLAILLIVVVQGVAMQFLNQKILMISMIWVTIGTLVLFLPLGADLEKPSQLSEQIEAGESITLVQTLFKNQ